MLPPNGELSLQATCVNELEQVELTEYTAIAPLVSALPPMVLVLMVVLPVAGATKRYHTSPPEYVPQLGFAPPLAVAPSLLPTTVEQLVPTVKRVDVQGSSFSEQVIHNGAQGFPPAVQPGWFTRTRNCPVNEAVHCIADRLLLQALSLNPTEIPLASLISVRNVFQLAVQKLNVYMFPAVTFTNAYCPPRMQPPVMLPGHGTVMAAPESILKLPHCPLPSSAEKEDNARRAVRRSWRGRMH